ncbi:MAG: ferric reductase-like transmembrane domain-containing protein [Candidatus Moraniibacteriota bacterium]
MESIISLLHPFLRLCYRLHDVASDFLVRHIFAVKRGVLVLAHLSLFGFLFPEMRKDFGELAANLLIVILFISPLSKIFRMRLLVQLMMLRRELGIMMGYLATVHGLGYLIDPDWTGFILQPLLAGDLWGSDPRYIFGLLAYVFTLPLLLTSNALAQKYMGAKWKLLHRTVYLMFALAIIHRFLIKGAPVFVIVEIVLLLGSYGLAKVLAWKNFLPHLVKAIRLIADDYHRFKISSTDRAVAPMPSSTTA